MKTVDDSRARMLTQTHSPSRPYVENYILFLKPGPGTAEVAAGSEEPQFVGMVGAIRILENAPPELDVNGLPEFGYMIEVGHQRKGFGTEAAKGFLELYWSLERRKEVQRVVATVRRTNVGSGKVIQSIGGVRVGDVGEDEQDAWVVSRPVGTNIPNLE